MDDKQRTAMEAANPHILYDVRVSELDMAYQNGAYDGFREGYTAAMHAHDAEIADLRENCDKLAEYTIEEYDKHCFHLDREITAMKIARSILAKAGGH